MRPHVRMFYLFIRLFLRNASLSERYPRPRGYARLTVKRNRGMRGRANVRVRVRARIHVRVHLSAFKWMRIPCLVPATVTRRDYCDALGVCTRVRACARVRARQGCGKQRYLVFDPLLSSSQPPIGLHVRVMACSRRTRI